MSRPPRALPPSLGTVFTPEQARAAGVTARRLRARDLDHVHRGLLVISAPDEAEFEDGEPFARDRAMRTRMLRRAQWYDRVMVAHAFFVGRTAAGIWRLPVECDGELEVGVLPPHRAPRRRGISGRQIASHLVSVCERDGLRVAGPASTWALLAEDLSVRELIVVGDAAVHVPRDEFARRRPEQALATVEQLRAAVAAGSRRGVEKLRAAVERVCTASASPLETDFRLDAEEAGLPAPTLDAEIRDRRGRLLGVTELAYLEFAVLVEIEGDHHRTSRRQWNRDIEKYAAYVAEGFEVVRLTSAHIRSADAVGISMVRDALIRHGWRP
ncbi:hypothetical protein [Microbacterium saperdae]|uniref:DUF559 domain-containing protein n=1 Tax=Microbacterium saperdae TaxID=69368 RepID=A0A543BIC9_9MICO|nr:hypothetical protein [Microbacterium saperdae]TQL84610.1 hypothetical protein FB560_0197 [Microbacterium saperdae]GGM61715.1 hypothetical protein GCM10010489_36520 [Microbacterium saperdae]